MRPLRLIFALLIFALLIALGASASASSTGVPDPRFSTIPDIIRICPAGDLTQVVTVRDVNNALLENVTVDLNFCACPSIVLCPPMTGDSYTIVGGCTVRVLTGPSGTASFPIRGGGGCSTFVEVSADGVVLGNIRYTASPDQDGSRVVDATDAAILSGKIGGPDRTGDLNDDGVVDSGDSAILDLHLGHACANVTPTQGTSWGQLKEIYR